MHNFKLEDLQVTEDDMRYHNKERHNAIRTNIYNQRFYSAIKDAEALIEDNKQKLTVQDIFTKNLAQKLSMDSYRKRKKLRALAETYAKIGFIYYKLGVPKKSLDYFKVAKALSKGQKISEDYEVFATTLEEQLTYDEQMLNSNDNFGLGNITYITDFIAESESDVESACSLLRLNEDEIRILMLVYAKEFYSSGNLEKGDELLKTVSQKENNSLEIKKLI